MTDYSKIPPQAPELETVLLGALLIDPVAIDEVINILRPEAFYKDAHQRIFQAILDLHKIGAPIDVLTVTQQLKNTSSLEESGGATYISRLTGRVGSSAHASYHAGIVTDHFVRREVIRISHEAAKLAFDDTIDPTDLTSELYSEAVGLQDRFIRGRRGSHVSYAADAAINAYYDRKKAAEQGLPPGIPTPLNKLDEVTGGWQKGSLVIMAGRPSMGKTAFAIASTLTAAKAGRAALFFSLEMTATDLSDRMLISISGVDPNRYKAGHLESHEEYMIERAAGELEKLPIIIDDAHGLSIDAIHARARAAKRKNRCDVVFIDYLGLVSSKKERNKSREQEVAEISVRAKGIAKDLKVPVVLLSQLNRSCEARSDKRPMLSDLRESGSVEQDADQVILLYRAHYYGITQDGKGSTFRRGEAIMAKNRNGRTGTIHFDHNDSLTEIKNSELT